MIVGRNERLTSNDQVVELLHCLVDSDAGTAASRYTVDRLHQFERLAVTLILIKATLRDPHRSLTSPTVIVDGDDWWSPKSRHGGGAFFMLVIISVCASAVVVVFDSVSVRVGAGEKIDVEHGATAFDLLKGRKEEADSLSLRDRIALNHSMWFDG